MVLLLLLFNLVYLTGNSDLIFFPTWKLMRGSLTAGSRVVVQSPSQVQPFATLWTAACQEAEFSSIHLLSRVPLFANPWTAARQASLSITNSQSSPKSMYIESVMPSNHLILCCPLLLLPSIFPSIRVFSNESTLRIRWPKYWSFSFSISPSNEHSGMVSFRMDWISLQSKGLPSVFSNTTVQKHQFFGAQLSSQSNSHIHIWPLEKP